MLIKTLYTKNIPGNLLKNYDSRKDLPHVSKCLTYEDVTFATKSKFNSNIFNLWYLCAPKAFEDFQENILTAVILVYNRYSEQPVCDLTKRRTLPSVFSGDTFEMDGCEQLFLKQSKRKISKRTFLVDPFWYLIVILNN